MGLLVGLILFLGVLLFVSMIMRKSVQRVNTLYECNKCERYFRRWQGSLFSAKNNIVDGGQCPHCDISGRYMAFSKKVESKDDKKWMKVHEDCPVIDIKGLFKAMKTIIAYEKMHKDKDSFDDWEEYNKKPTSDWIEKLGTIENTYKF